ncbi:restriction endonuclease subunit S [Vibrio parahaemolyticus]|nr:restriction endonuclease subunit S [Vibrio parahaemolyticus]
MVPNGWKLKKLNDVFKVIDSLHQTPTFSDTGLPMVRVTDVKGGILNLSNTVKVSEKVFSEYTKKYTPKKHDIVFSRVGSYGISSYVDSNEPFCLGQNTVIAESNDNAVSKYIFNVLKSTYVKRQIERTVDGSSHKTVSLKVIRALDIPIPPLPEQRKIAQILSTWDRGIATTEKLIEASKQQKKALMQQLLTGKKRLVDPETGKAFEGEWEEVKLANICSKITDGAHHSPASVEEGFPMYSVKDMGKSGFKKGTARLIGKEDYLCLEQQNCRPLINDILIAKDGSILKHCFVMEKQCDGVILSSIAILRPDLEKICPAFVAHFLSQDYVKKYVAKVFTTGSGVPRIVLKDFKSIKLKLGSLAEQQKIASVLTTADKDIELLETKLAHLKLEKKSLMQQLLTGKRRVQVAETEAA